MLRSHDFDFAEPFTPPSLTAVLLHRTNSLDADARLAPMSPLCVVSADNLVSPLLQRQSQHRHFCSSSGEDFLLSYLMVLPVLNLIHCGIGRFCFCALASFCFVLKVLWDYRFHQQTMSDYL